MSGKDSALRMALGKKKGKTRNRGVHFLVHPVIIARGKSRQKRGKGVVRQESWAYSLWGYGKILKVAKGSGISLLLSNAKKRPIALDQRGRVVVATPECHSTIPLFSGRDCGREPLRGRINVFRKSETTGIHRTLTF